MRAMILAAGVGSRLAPITDVLPKPLIPVLGETVLDRIISILTSSGFNELVANTHYRASQIHRAYSNLLEIREEKQLSGVAGGIRCCADFLRAGNNTFAVIMGDALTDLNLTEMLRIHKLSGRPATIAVKQVKDTSQFGVVCFDAQNKVSSFQEKPKAEQALSNWANTGVYLFEPEILDYIPSVQERPTYDVAHDLFPALLEAGLELNIYETNAYWADLGTHAQYRQALFDGLNGIVKIDIPGQSYSWGFLGDYTKLDPSCFIRGKAYIGKNCQIGQAVLQGNVVVEDNCIIEDDVVLDNCLIMSGCHIQKGSRLKERNILSGSTINPFGQQNSFISRK